MVLIEKGHLQLLLDVVDRLHGDGSEVALEVALKGEASCLTRLYWVSILLVLTKDKSKVLAEVWVILTLVLVLLDKKGVGQMQKLKVYLQRRARSVWLGLRHGTW